MPRNCLVLDPFSYWNCLVLDPFSHRFIGCLRLPTWAVIKVTPQSVAVGESHDRRMSRSRHLRRRLHDASSWTSVRGARRPTSPTSHARGRSTATELFGPGRAVAPLKANHRER